MQAKSNHSLTQLGQAVAIVPGIALLTGLLSYFSVISEFPLNLMLLIIPFGMTFLTPFLFNRSTPILMIGLAASGPWIGYAATFHLYYGFWDGQGIVIALIGYPISLMFLIPAMLAIKKSLKTKASA